MGKKAPATPDYVGAAEKTADSSAKVTNMQTWANRPTLNTPWGQQSWDTSKVIDPATGQPVTQWTMNTNLTPDSQGALDSQMRIDRGKSSLAEGLLGRAGSEANRAIDYTGIDPMSGVKGTPGAFYNKAGDAIMAQFNRYQAPGMAAAQSDKVAQLNAQGLKPGDAGYDRAMASLTAQQDQEKQAAMDSATLMSANVGHQMYGDTLQGQNFNNTVHQQQITEQLQRQGFSLNQINAILTGAQVSMPNMPGFNTAAASQATNYTGAAQDAYAANLNAANASNANISGVASLAGGAMMMSDRRLKKNVVRVGIGSHGYPIYEFTYIDEPDNVRHYGVMADEVNQDAVHKHESGFDMVDYGALRNGS